MNNKDFIAALAQRVELEAGEVQTLVDDVVRDITEHLQEGTQVGIAGFGVFEVKKKMERVVIHPTTRQKMLVPPKLVVNFRSASTLKDKIQ